MAAVPQLQTRARLRGLLEPTNCATHWQYLLSNQGTVVHLQCPDCGHLWSTDTRRRRQRRTDAA